MKNFKYIWKGNIEKELYIIVILLLPLALLSDTVLFSKFFGGTGDEFVNSVQQTKDDGYIMAGSTCSFGNGSPRIPDWWIIKLDKNGNKEWDKTFGESDKDAARSVRQTIDGGYVAAGWIGLDMVILKLDADGRSTWMKILAGKIVSAAFCIEQTADSGYVVTGRGEDNILKLDSEGNKEWSEHFGWNLYSVQQTEDGGYIAAGDSIYRQLEWDYLSSLSIFKLDQFGNKEWSNPLGDDYLGRAYSVHQTAEGGYIIAGDSVDFKSEYEYSRYLMVIKLDGNGNREWNYSGEQFSGAQSVQQTADGGYIIAGSKIDDGYGNDYLIVKLDKNGNEEWKKSFGEKGLYDYASSVQQVSDNGYIVAGQTESYGAGLYDIWILRLDENGNGPGPVGISHYNDYDFRGFLLNQNYPNPFNPNTKIKFKLDKSCSVSLKILDLLGRELETLINEHKQPGEYIIEWTAKDLPSGIYLYKLEAEDYVETKKMILQQ